MPRSAFQRMRQTGRFIAILLGNLVVFSLLALALEAASRALDIRFPALGDPGGDRALWVYDLTKGWYHVPGSRGESYRGGPDPGRIRINSLGLRGRETSRFKKPGARRVLVFGDSFVFGGGVDEEHLFTTHLEELLRESTGRVFEVINMGISGYSTDQELLLFEELGLRLGPDVVVLVVCDNDFEGNTLDFVYRRYYKPYFQLGARGQLVRRNIPVPRLSRSEQVRLWLAQHSNIWNAVRTRKPLSRATATIVDLFQVRPPRRSGEDAMRLMTQLVWAFRDLSERAGASFAVFNTGHRGEKTPLFHALRVHLREERIAFLGLEEELARGRASSPEANWDFGHDTHWNIDSHRVVAEVVHGYLRAARLLPAVPQAGARDRVPYP